MRRGSNGVKLKLLTEASFNGGSFTNSLFSDSLILELLCRLSPFFSVMPSTFNFLEIFVTGGVLSDSGFFLPSILNDMRKQNNRKCHFFSIRHSVLNFNCVTFICTDILHSPVSLSFLISLLFCLKGNQMCLHYHFHIYNHVLHGLIAVEFAVISIIRFAGHIVSFDVIQKNK